MNQTNDIVETRKFALSKALEYARLIDVPSDEKIVDTAKKFERFLDGEVKT